MFRRLLLAACPALLLLAAIASPAQAKGAESVTISGPGIDHVKLTYTGHGVDVNTVAEATLIYEMAFGSPRDLHDKVPAPETLGPAYTVDYDFFDEHVVQTVYPLASPHPAIYLPPGQELYGSRVPSRWLAAPSDLRRTLARLGAPLKELAAESVEAVPQDTPLAAEPARAGTDEGKPSTDGALDLWWLVAGLMAAAAAGLSWLGWRRRHPLAEAADIR
jgi:hypothetical protein